MPHNPPRHSVQKLRTKHRPNEKMLPQHRTSRHNTAQHNGSPKRHKRNMRPPHLSISPRISLAFLLARHLIQVLALPGDPISDVQFIRVDEALRGAVAAEEEDSRERPEDGSRPVGEEDEEADGGDVVV